MALGKRCPPRVEQLEDRFLPSANFVLQWNQRLLEVQQLRGQGNQQIADGLYISLSTVKTHINNLFRKLDAGDRDSALQAARALKLVD